MKQKRPELYSFGLNTYLILSSGKRVDYNSFVNEKAMQYCIKNSLLIAKYKKLFERLSHTDCVRFIEKEFMRWEECLPEDPCVASWLIDCYDAELVESSFNEMEYSGKSLEEEISRLKNIIAEKDQIIAEKDAIIKQKTKEHDEYVELNGSSELDKGTTFRYIISKGNDIRLTDKERDIIEYVIHCVALKPKDGKLDANIKRLIGKERTVSSHFNDSKKNSSRPLTKEEIQHIKSILTREGIKYEDILKDHL